MTVEQASTPLLEVQASPPIRRVPVWPAYAFAGVMLFYQFVLGIALGIVLGVVMGLRLFGLQSADDLRALFASPPFLLTLLGVVSVLNLAMAAGYLMLTRRLPPRIRLLRRGRATILSLSIVTAGALALSQIFAIAAHWLSMRSHATQTFQRLVTTNQHAYSLLAFLLVGMVGPIAEEVVFRGCIQPRLIRRHGPIIGIIITSFIFGVYHWEIVQGIFAFTSGLYLGAVAHRTGSILGSTLCHMANNLFALSVAYFQIPTGSHAALVVTVFCCPVLLTAAAYLLYRMPAMTGAARVSEPRAIGTT